jgi:predicted outer membrane repeat protein
MPPRKRRATRLAVEVLEGRCLPSTFTVTNLLDDGSAGSLRMCIQAANTHPGPDTVVFRRGLEGTIRVTTGAHIAIFDNLTLIGPGASKIAVAGSGKDTVFLVDNGAGGADLNVRIQGLELRGGAAGGGGAILSNENLTLVGVVIDQNRATDGGAIYVRGNLTIRNCSIFGNEAGTSGGGIYFDGDVLTVERSTLSGNKAAHYGGGLFVKAGTAAIRNSVLSGNTAAFSAGGLYAGPQVTDLTIESTGITDNRATGAMSNGGGITSFAVQTTITKSTITSNFAAGAGGGLFSFGGTAVIDRSVISGNTAYGGVGGGIFQSMGSLSLTASTVSGNHADLWYGGGISLDQVPNGSVITASTISGNTARKGGGLDAYQSPLTLRNSTVSGNQATSYGGGLYESGSDLVVANSTIAYNRGGLNGSATGGGISSHVGTVDLESSIVARNSAAAGHPDLYSNTTPYSAAHSLIGTTDGAASFTDNGGNLIGPDKDHTLDPLLAPLDFYGGPTQTHALKKGSPAINQGFNFAGSPFDQRGPGHKRQLGFAVDIGAFERQ